MHKPINDSVNPISERALRARYLCFLNGNDRAKRFLVDDWVAVNPGKPLTDLVIAYTSKHFTPGSQCNNPSIWVVANQIKSSLSLSVNMGRYFIEVGLKLTNGPLQRE